MLDHSAWRPCGGQGYGPYYLYRQKYMSGSLENVGWARPGTESLYNIVHDGGTAERAVTRGWRGHQAGGPAAGTIVPAAQPQISPRLSGRLGPKCLAQKDEMAAFY